MQASTFGWSLEPMFHKKYAGSSPTWGLESKKLLQYMFAVKEHTVLFTYMLP